MLGDLLLENVEELVDFLKTVQESYRLMYMLTYPGNMEPYFFSIFKHLQFGSATHHFTIFSSTANAIYGIFILSGDRMERNMYFSRVYRVTTIADEGQSDNEVASVLNIISRKLENMNLDDEKIKIQNALVENEVYSIKVKCELMKSVSYETARIGQVGIHQFNNGEESLCQVRLYDKSDEVTGEWL